MDEDAAAVKTPHVDGASATFSKTVSIVAVLQEEGHTEGETEAGLHRHDEEQQEPEQGPEQGPEPEQLDYAPVAVACSDLAAATPNGTTPNHDYVLEARLDAEQVWFLRSDFLSFSKTVPFLAALFLRALPFDCVSTELARPCPDLAVPSRK